MSYKQEFVIKNLINNTIVEVEEGIIKYPLFNSNQYKIKVSFANSAYAKKYRKAVRWDFGDGTVKVGPSAEHYYKVAGKYKITCTFYDIDRKPVENQYVVTAIVKEVFPIKLNFAKESIKEVAVKRSKISKLVSINSSVSANVSTLAPIMVHRINEDKTHKSYYDIRKDNYYHLNRYYAFLDESIDYSFKKDDDGKITLSPTEYFIPSYTAIYVKFINDTTKVIPELYAYIQNEKIALPETHEIYNPNASVLVNHNSSSDDDYYLNIPIKKVGYLSELPAGAEFCGWLSQFNIWYKDDYAGKSDIYFNYDTSYLKFYDYRIDSNAINIPPLGLTVNVEEPTEDIIYALSCSGLIGESKLEGDDLKAEIHLAHNLYKDHEIEAYFARYIKNDLDNSWSILKDTNALPRLTASGCTISLDEENISTYINRYILKPTEKSIEIIAEDKIFKREMVDSLFGIQIPLKKYEYISFDDVLDTYMQHPMYEDTQMIKNFFQYIFNYSGTFEEINNKGFGFFDNIVNHKTCYINNLQSILEMFGSSEQSYNINSFDKINELKELVRILSMNHSILFGQVEKEKYDININGDAKGKNVGDRILPNDIIVCDINKEIIGIIRDNKVYPVGIPLKYIIIHDDFNKLSRIATFENAESYTLPDIHEEILAQGIPACYYYSLNDYHYSWNWNLKLPAGVEEYHNKAMAIDGYYSFYLLAGNTAYKRKYNFLEEENLPYSKESNSIYITPGELYKDFGYSYDCLMKILLYKLGLN